jgi:hypothetical protein
LKKPNLKSPQMAALLAAVAVAAIAVPAWAQSDEGLEDELRVAQGPGAAGPGVVGRDAHPIPVPGVARAAMLPAALPPGAEGRDHRVVPLPPPEDLPGGEPPTPPDAGFPLSEEEIEWYREALETFAQCMRDHGQDVGDPELGPYQIAIPLGEDAFSEEFREAEEDCGGPPPIERP